MRLIPAHNQGDRWQRRRHEECGGARTLLLALVCFILGTAAAAFWFHHPASQPPAPEPAVQLSNGTHSVLDHLDKPVEIRFYSLLDPGSPETLREFSSRVKRLLSAYQQQASGRIVVSWYDAQTNTTPNAALTDGIQGFNLDKGEDCYLGVTLVCEGRKQVLPRLAPEWESALEADLSRSIQQLTQASLAASQPAGPSPDPEVIHQVKQGVPDFASTSLEEGSRKLREATLKEFTTTVNEMQSQLHDAQARLQQAQASGTEADQQSALKHLQELQNAQTQKLKDIAARAQAQIEALKQLKAAAK